MGLVVLLIQRSPQCKLSFSTNKYLASIHYFHFEKMVTFTAHHFKADFAKFFTITRPTRRTNAEYLLVSDAVSKP